MKILINPRHSRLPATALLVAAIFAIARAQADKLSS